MVRCSLSSPVLRSHFSHSWRASSHSRPRRSNSPVWTAGVHISYFNQINTNPLCVCPSTCWTSNKKSYKKKHGKFLIGKSVPVCREGRKCLFKVLVKMYIWRCEVYCTEDMIHCYTSPYKHLISASTLVRLHLLLCPQSDTGTDSVKFINVNGGQWERLGN